jgi:hypothetical protein
MVFYEFTESELGHDGTKLIRYISFDLSHTKRADLFMKSTNPGWFGSADLYYEIYSRCESMPSVELVYIVCPDGVDITHMQKGFEGSVFKGELTRLAGLVGKNSDSIPTYKAINKKDFYSLAD